MAEVPDSPEALKAALGYEHNFARVESVGSEGVAVSFDLDRARWPWLALPPAHPVLVEKVQYFSAVTASWAAGSMQPGTRSALTRIVWSCAPGVETYPRSGLFAPWRGERDMGYRLSVRDARGREIYVISGEGFAFEDRDFGAWRERSRRAARAATAGLERPAIEVPLFVAPPRPREGRPVSAALVSSDGGFHPGHPYHTGTGDHVNAAHLLDCALQMARHQRGIASDTALACRGGEARFQRFVELDVPFEVHVAGREAIEGGEALALGFAQAGRENARVRIELADPVVL